MKVQGLYYVKSIYYLIFLIYCFLNCLSECQVDTQASHQRVLPLF